MQTFQRNEKKYLLNRSQYEGILEDLKPYVEKDKFYEAKIRSIYYDTDSYELIRRSIERPEYKEKLRIRSYDEADPEDTVYVELKKKYDGTVYKRRTRAVCGQLLKDISKAEFKDTQVGKEISYALSFYRNLKPAVYIGCTRTSYKAKNRDLRITFDQDISYRMKNLSLHSGSSDKRVTDKIVMEIKVKDAYPLWLCEILDKNQAYPQRFSKAGTAFLQEIKGGINHD
ncbi:MAG: polyphosphate polymerase domain-containing protein [Erysipelotrichaceae bacterium]|nr:polyphosphate polymerase domain-containing protein [Erysipelotrichaceae bacterium]